MPKIYKEKAILIGAFLGGPIAAGYLIAQNFSTFNQPKKERNTWITSILLTILLFWTAFTFEFIQKLPYALLPFLYGAIAPGIVFIYQSKSIEQHLITEGESYSNSRAILIGLFGAVFTIGTITMTAFVSEIKTEKQNFGTLNHEILFEKGKIADEEVKQLGLL